MSDSISANPWASEAGIAADRRQKSSRAAFERILDRTPAQDRRIAANAAALAANKHPMIAAQHRRIVAGRAQLSRRGEYVAVGGALTTIGLVAWMCITVAAPIGEQAIRILVATLALGMFRLAMVDGSKLLGTQLWLQLAATVALVGFGNSENTSLITWDAAMLVLGWSALGFRWLQHAEARHLDLDEMELMMAAQGRRPASMVREDIRRQDEAAI